MGDVTIVWDPTTGTGDFVMVNGDLEQGHELETGILISLFSDRVADSDDLLLPQQAGDPRGWWADTYEDDPIGSKLWQVFTRPFTDGPQGALNWVRDQVAKSLQWMVDEGVAASVDTAVFSAGKGQIGVTVLVTEPNGTRTPYSYAWAQEV